MDQMETMKLEKKPYKEDIRHDGRKALPFNCDYPEIWFKQVEAKFQLDNVITDEEKFNVLMSIVPPEVLENTRDAVSNAPASGKYENLRNCILDHLSQNQNNSNRNQISITSRCYFPEVWIKKLEAKFYIDKVTSDEEKFNTLLVAAECEVLAAVPDAVFNVPALRKYEIIRKCIFDYYSSLRQSNSGTDELEEPVAKKRKLNRMDIRNHGTKMLPFHIYDPIMWFRKVEAMFQLDAVITDEEKFNILVWLIPSAMLAGFRNAVCNAPAPRKYEHLRKCILSRYLILIQEDIMISGKKEILYEDDNPEEYFTKLEAKFHTDNVTSDEEKFNTLLVMAPYTLLKNIPDVAFNEPMLRKYKNLRMYILNKYMASNQSNSGTDELKEKSNDKEIATTSDNKVAESK